MCVDFLMNILSFLRFGSKDRANALILVLGSIRFPVIGFRVSIKIVRESLIRFEKQRLRKLLCNAELKLRDWVKKRVITFDIYRIGEKYL